MPNQEEALARPFGNGPVRVGAQGLFCPCLKAFIMPTFLPARLTVAGSSRMLKMACEQETPSFLSVKHQLKCLTIS